MSLNLRYWVACIRAARDGGPLLSPSMSAVRNWYRAFPSVAYTVEHSSHFPRQVIITAHKVTTQRRMFFIPVYLLAVVEAIRLHMCMLHRKQVPRHPLQMPNPCPSPYHLPNGRFRRGHDIVERGEEVDWSIPQLQPHEL
jgi:hypothetical protein